MAPTARGAAARAIGVALVVGPILTIINQWSAVTGPDPLDWAKAALTSCVPFIVSFVSSLLTGAGIAARIAELEQQRADFAAHSQNLANTLGDLRVAFQAAEDRHAEELSAARAIRAAPLRLEHPAPEPIVHRPAPAPKPPPFPDTGAPRQEATPKEAPCDDC